MRCTLARIHLSSTHVFERLEAEASRSHHAMASSQNLLCCFIVFEYDQVPGLQGQNTVPEVDRCRGFKILPFTWSYLTFPPNLENIELAGSRQR